MTFAELKVGDKFYTFPNAELYEGIIVKIKPSFDGGLNIFYRNAHENFFREFLIYRHELNETHVWGWCGTSRDAINKQRAVTIRSQNLHNRHKLPF